MPDKGYAFFEHTADVGMRAWGATLEELFRHAAKGLVELLVEDSVIALRETRSVVLSASTVEGLLHHWLTELIGRFDMDQFLPGGYEFDAMSETALRGRLSGECFQLGRHTHGVEVKGVTRHQFRVEHATGRWEARVIFDV